MSWNAVQLELDFGGTMPVVKKPNDNKIISELQEQFLQDRSNEKIKLELWQAITACARRMIFNERKKRGFYLSYDEMDYKATSCTEYIFLQYAKKPEWKMKSPAGYVFLRVLAALYRHKKLEEYLIYTDKEL